MRHAGWEAGGYEEGRGSASSVPCTSSRCATFGLPRSTPTTAAVPLSASSPFLAPSKYNVVRLPTLISAVAAPPGNSSIRSTEASGALALRG